MLSYVVAVTHNSPRPAPSAATRKSRPVTRLFAPRKSKFLIATPRFEFPPTPSKQSPLTCTLPAATGIRDFIALFRSEIAQTPRRIAFTTSIDHEFSRAFRTPGIPAGAFDFRLPGTADLRIGAFAFSPLTTHHSPARQPYGGPLLTAFLIYGPAIRKPRKP
jgi:hypothetical protein